MIQIKNNMKIKDVTNVVNDSCPSFSGIVNQECKGRLWVDDIEAPTLALAESYAVGSFAFLGVHRSEEVFSGLKAFLEAELFVQIKENGYHSFEFSIDNDDIRESILGLFKEKEIQTEKEFSFRGRAIPVITKDISKEYQIRKVDASFWKLLSEGNVENGGFLQDRLLGSWHSFEEFDRKSVAYCTIYNNRIVAVIVGTASFHNIIPIDIETEEEHRRQGLAYAMTTEFIADCFRNNYIPQWDCVESNLNSYHMAQKLGFEKIHENTVYWFDI